MLKNINKRARIVIASTIILAGIYVLVQLLGFYCLFRIGEKKQIFQDDNPYYKDSLFLKEVMNCDGLSVSVAYSDSLRIKIICYDDVQDNGHHHRSIIKTLYYSISE